MMIKDTEPMESNTPTIVGTAATVISGIGAWMFNKVNNCQKQQTALELHIAEHHMTKDAVKEFVELTNAPIKLSIDTMNTQVKSVDDKVDRLLRRGQ